MDKFRVTASLNTPLVSSGGYMTLDGLLAALLFERLQDVDRAHSEVPLRCPRGLYHGSAAVIEPFDRSRVTFIAGLRPTHSIDPDLILKNKAGRLHRKFDTSLTNVANSYELLSVPAVTWYGEGDAEQVEQLLRGVPFIGKRRASGFGEVTDWRIEPDELDGVTGHFGEPLRPVPVELFEGDKSYPVADAAWRPAYWNPLNRAACYAP